MTRFFLDDRIYFSVGVQRHFAGEVSVMAAGLGERPMARKRKPAESEKPIEGKPEPAARRNVVSIRGTEQWRDGLMGLAAHRRLKASDVIEQALIEYAQKYGYDKAPPPR